MKLALALFIPLLLLVGNTYGQTAQITGRVIDSATMKPLADASVYIANTTLGTKTNQNGIYNFPNLSPGNYQLLFSCVGYQTRQAELSAGAGSHTVNIVLKQRYIELKEVTIDASDWQRNLALFKREFIGTTNALDCKVLNPDVLNIRFNRQANLLTVNSDEFLDIENSVLGYKLRFLVKDFWADYNTRKCHYSGTVIFEELVGKKSDQKRWAKSRREAYNGSFRHFLTSLYMGRLTQDKFLVIPLIRKPNPARASDSLIKEKKIYFTARVKAGEKHAGDSLSKWTAMTYLPRIKEELGPFALHEPDLVKFTRSDQPQFNLQFPGYIYVIYRDKNVDVDTDDLFRFNEARAHQISALSLKDPAKPTVFDSKGLLLSKETLFFEGAWNNRILNMLPYDYVPEVKN